MWEAAPVQGFDSYVKGTSNYEDTANSDIVLLLLVLHVNLV